MLCQESSQRTRIGTDEKEALHKKQGGRCNYCGLRGQITLFHIDHKMPLSRGGSDKFNNLQLLCGFCNTSKGSMSDGEHRRKYKGILLPAREAKGPPTRAIPYARFQEVQKKKQKRAAARRQNDDTWVIFG